MGYHVPIMFDECMNALDVQSGGLYFDGTLGGGGHSYGILSRGGRLIATDRDSDAIEYCRRRFGDIREFDDKYTLVKSNFKDVNNVLDNYGIAELNGAILDLGISSHQIDTPERGFSYRFDADLDMRMDVGQKLTAYTVVNEYSEKKLTEILFKYGEERFARRIVKNILSERGLHPIKTTGQLTEIIKRSVPYDAKSHPAKKTFQAIRIEVNGELSGLSEALESIVGRLCHGGRMCVMTFHSLEDRIVKQTFGLLATDCICDKSLPICVCGHKASVKLMGKGIKASLSEQQSNPRSSSATLRLIEKL